MCIKILKQLLVIIFAVSVFASCTKNEPVIIEKPVTIKEEMPNGQSTMQNLLKTDFEVKTASAEVSKVMCFELNFPLQVTYPDKTTKSVDSFKALENAFNTWYEENKNAKEEPMLNFPIEVALADGSIELLSDEIALITLMKECFENENFVERKCFEINYPIEVELKEQDATIVINNEEEFESKLKGKDEDIKYAFVYPIEVTLAKGEVKTLASKDDFKALKKYCGKKDKGEDKGFGRNFAIVKNNCFEVAYPLELNLPDASKITINNADDFFETIKTYRNDKEALSKIAFTYPINVVWKGEDTFELASQEELKELLAKCKEDKGNRDDEGKDDDDDRNNEDWEEDYEAFAYDFVRNGCFKVQLPVSFTLKNGNTVTANSYEAIIETLIEQAKENNGEIDDLAIAYPITVTLYADRKSLTLNNEEELESLYKTCEDNQQAEDFHEDLPNHPTFGGEIGWYGQLGKCFTFEQPFSLTVKNEVIEIAENDDVLKTLFSFYRSNEFDLEDVSLNFPVTIIMEDQSTEVLNSQEDFDKFIENCRTKITEGWEEEDKDFDWGNGDFDFDFDWNDFDLDNINFDELDLSQFDFSNFKDLDAFKIYCFEINFPITVNFGNEERITAENFGELIKQMFEVILTSNGRDIEPEVNYPITVTMEDDTIRTINSNDEFEELAKSCID